MSLLAFVGAFLIQSSANKEVRGCSYLDPVTVDVSALIMGGFLVLEGWVDIFRHRESSARQQLYRCLRIALGVAILTIHIMQFSVKIS